MAVFVLPGGDPVVAAGVSTPAGETALGKLLAGLDGVLDGHVEGGIMRCEPVGKRRVCGYDQNLINKAAAAGRAGGGEITALLARVVPASERGGLVEWFQRMPEARDAGSAGAGAGADAIDIGAAFAGATLVFAAGDLRDGGAALRVFAPEAGRAQAARILGRRTGGGPGTPGGARARAMATLGDDGAGLIAGSLDLAELYAAAEAADPRVAQGESMLRNFLGVSLRGDVVGSLTGEMALVARPAERGAALILGARDAKAAERMVGKVDSALKQALLLMDIMGGTPDGWEIKRSDAKDIAPNARRLSLKGPILLPGPWTDDLGRITLIYLPVGDTVVLSLDNELAKRAATRGSADGARFQQRVRAGRTLVASAPMVLWAESFDPLESVDANILAKCGDATRMRCGSPADPMRDALSVRFGETRVRAAVEAARYWMDRGEEVAASLEVRPQGAAARVEVAYGARGGAAGAAYRKALAQKYSGDFEGFRTALFGAGQSYPGTSVARRARLSADAPHANYSPLQLILGPLFALLGL